MAKDSDDIVYLKPSDTGKALEFLLAEREPVIIVSRPGMGKTDITGQASCAVGNELLPIHPVLGDPTDGKGMPWFSAGKDYAVFLPFEDAWQIINAKDPLTVFLDDLGQAPPAVQASWMRPVLARSIAGHPVPAHVTFIAATNRRTDKAGVSGILEPVKGRFTIIHMTSDLDDFCNNLFDRGQSYGLSENMIVAGAAFLRFREPLLNAFEATADITNSPTERNWVAAFRHASNGNNRMPTHIIHALIAGRVGSGAAVEFMGFLDIYRQLPSLDAILADPDNAIIPETPAAQFAVSVGLASKATEKNFVAIAKYADRLEKHDLGEYASLLVRDSVRRNSRVANTQAYIKLCSSETGKLMTGRA